MNSLRPFAVNSTHLIVASQQAGKRHVLAIYFHILQTAGRHPFMGQSKNFLKSEAQQDWRYSAAGRALVLHLVDLDSIPAVKMIS